jgi:hypothetical protein
LGIVVLKVLQLPYPVSSQFRVQVLPLWPVSMPPRLARRSGGGTAVYWDRLYGAARMTDRTGCRWCLAGTEGGRGFLQLAALDEPYAAETEKLPSCSREST